MSFGFSFYDLLLNLNDFNFSGIFLAHLILILQKYIYDYVKYCHELFMKIVNGEDTFK